MEPTFYDSTWPRLFGAVWVPQYANTECGGTLTFMPLTKDGKRLPLDRSQLPENIREERRNSALFGVLRTYNRVPYEVEAVEVSGIRWEDDRLRVGASRWSFQRLDLGPFALMDATQPTDSARRQFREEFAPLADYVREHLEEVRLYVAVTEATEDVLRDCSPPARCFGVPERLRGGLPSGVVDLLNRGADRLNAAAAAYTDALDKARALASGPFRPDAVRSWEALA